MTNPAKTGSKAKLLYSEGDAEVLSAQTAALQKAGHEVHTASDRKSVLSAVQQGKFELVILGGTLSKNDRHHLAYKVKKAIPETRVLVLHTDGERHPAVDANLDTGCSLDSVLAKVSSLCASPATLTRAAAAGK